MCVDDCGTVHGIHWIKIWVLLLRWFFICGAHGDALIPLLSSLQCGVGVLYAGGKGRRHAALSVQRIVEVLLHAIGPTILSEDVVRGRLVGIRDSFLWRIWEQKIV